jgi:hypothetical protein
VQGDGENHCGRVVDGPSGRHDCPDADPHERAGQPGRHSRSGSAGLEGLVPRLGADASVVAAVDHDELRDARERLDEVLSEAQVLRQHSTRRVAVAVHVDAVGGDVQHLVVSTQRDVQIRDVQRSIGVDHRLGLDALRREQPTDRHRFVDRSRNGRQALQVHVACADHQRCVHRCPLNMEPSVAAFGEHAKHRRGSRGLTAGPRHSRAREQLPGVVGRGSVHADLDRRCRQELGAQ